MSALNFFQAVLPSEGIYYLALIELETNRVSHKNFATLEEMAEATIKYDADDKYSVYHACASYQHPFIEIDSKMKYRVPGNWCKAKSFWVDLDCGEEKAAKGQGYLTKQDAANDINRFCDEHDFPKPMYVDSGNGVHCYWPLTKAIKPEVWKKIANAFKACLAADGVLADPTVTADFSRILRPPGTHNKKGEFKKVKVVKAVEPITPELFSERLKDIADKQKTKPAPNQAPSKHLNDDLTAHLSPKIPAYAKEIAKNCHQVALMRDTQGDVNYEHWRGTIGLITHCEEGIELAHEWSTRRQETGHTQTDVESKYSSWNAGPTTCDFFAKCNPQGCHGCPSEGAITSPIVLGRASTANTLMPESPAFLVETARSPLFLPDKNGSGKPLATTSNVKAVLCHEGVTARYNQMTKELEVIVPGVNSVPDEASNSNQTAAIDLLTKHGVPYARAQEQINAIAASNPYCPVRQMIESRPWDGICRFDSFIAQIETPHRQEASLYFRKWLIQAVAAVYLLDGLSAAGLLALTGPQGIGKTRLVRQLASRVPKGFLEGATLDPSNKDSVMTIASHWIVELGELDATFRKSDLAQLKAFITKQVDKFRRPYAKKDSEFPRRTVMAGTVNDPEFLYDNTGNRRFWAVQVNAIHIDHALDIQQLWAEAKTWYDAGESWHFNQEQQIALSQHNSQFEVVDPLSEKILMAFNFQDFSQESWMTATQIAEICGIQKPTNAEAKRISSFVKSLNGNKFRTSNGARLLRVPGRNK